MEIALKIEDLNKNFGRKQILHNVSMELYKGEVFGFLGPNGAGKTTTIKIIVGLIGKNSGTVSICGKDPDKDFEAAMANIGAIVENPEMYKYMTGYQNLLQYANMRKGVTKKRINEVAQLVGLSNRINDKVKNYSLGMRQRLGVAQALLHNPGILILDEPTNGLDPAGIKQLRDILQNLAHKENVCVLVSSHLLSEMQLMCDRVGIISNGKMIDVKSVDDLIRISAENTVTFNYYVNDSELAKTIIETDGYTDINIVSSTEFSLSIPNDDINTIIAKINKTLINNNVSLYTVNQVTSHNLEEAFMEMTKDGGTQIA